MNKTLTNGHHRLNIKKKADFKKTLIKSLRADWMLYVMIMIAVAHVFIFHYVPMYGIIMAFKKFKASLGIWGSPWVGFQHFETFMGQISFWKVVLNTLILSFYGLIFGFPAPILLALLLNEVKNVKFKKITQTISYLPHFLSTVIVVGMLVEVLSPSTGVVNTVIKFLGGEPIFFMQKSSWFRTIYISSGIWQGIGWGSIIYMAAIASIDQEMYDSAEIDGAGRFRKMWNITLPSIAPTIIILLIMRIGGLMNENLEKVMLIRNDLNANVAETIGYYVYRSGIIGSNFSYATAVGLFDAVVGLVLIAGANRISKKVSETSLW